MNYKTFKSKWMNKGVDVDGHYGFQCWDSFAQWCTENNIPVIDTTPVKLVVLDMLKIFGRRNLLMVF